MRDSAACGNGFWITRDRHSHPEEDGYRYICGGVRGAGFTIKTVNEYSLVVEKPSDSKAAAFFFGTGFNGTPNQRITLNFAGTNEQTHIRGRAEIVSNPGSAFEKTMDMSGNATGLQKDLTDVKALLESGVVGVDFGKDLILTAVAAGGPAERAGMKKGDKIQKVGGQPVTTFDDASKLLKGDPGSTVEVVVSRGGAESSFSLTRDTRASVYGKK